MNNGEINGNQSDSFLFHHLLAMFQTLALQQMGKLMNPITGKVERDLRQARITIDMIAMIQKKTSGNLSVDEKRLVDNILMDLQMNFVDEKSRGDDEEGEAGEDGGQSEGDAEPGREKKDGDED